MSVIEQLKGIISEKMEVDTSNIKPETTFIELGIDSLDLFELVFEVESDFGVSISDNAAGDISTVGDVVSLIESQL